MVANTEATEALRQERATPEVDQPADRDNTTADDESAVLQGEAARLQTEFDARKKRVKRGGDYLSHVLIHGTRIGTETNNP